MAWGSISDTNWAAVRSAVISSFAAWRASYERLLWTGRYKSDAWTKPYFDPDDPKFKERAFFAGV
jgi:hypothetical protein